MDLDNDDTKHQSSGDIEDWIKESRQRHYVNLSIEHGLTIEEIQKIHESTLGKLASVEPKFQMYIGIALPKAIDDYKKGQSIE